MVGLVVVATLIATGAVVIVARRSDDSSSSASTTDSSDTADSTDSTKVNETALSDSTASTDETTLLPGNADVYVSGFSGFDVGAVALIIHEPQTLSESTVPADGVARCATETGAVADKAMYIQIDATVTLYGDTPRSLAVDFFQPGIIVSYPDGGVSCGGPSHVTGVRFAAARPQKPYTFTFWSQLPGEVSPDKPNGDPGSLRQAELQLGIYVDDEWIEPANFYGPHVYDCGPSADHKTRIIALFTAPSVDGHCAPVNDPTAPPSEEPIPDTQPPTDSTSDVPAATDSIPAPPPPVGGGLVVGVDLPLQGGAKDASDDTNRAIQLVLEQAGGKAGPYSITLKSYDDSTAAKGEWDEDTCAANAAGHVGSPGEVAVLGTYNAGCTRAELQILNQDSPSPMLMVSHVNTNPGLTKPWSPGEPDMYYPSGVRNFARILAPDDLQAKAEAEFAANVLKVTRCIVLNDRSTYGVGLAAVFVQRAKDVGIDVVGEAAWDAAAGDYTTLLQGFKALKPDCVYLGGVADNNGEQLIRDKVAVFGPNDGAVKLIAPDGFLGYPSVDVLPEAQDMYVSLSGLPADEIVRNSEVAAKFVADFAAKYGHEPSTVDALYGAAAMQFILATVAASDGTRKGVTSAAFSGISIPAEQSLTGDQLGVDANGDPIDREISIEQIQIDGFAYLTAWST